uniref:Uncharacterized protein n=1 Tax=Opuntia streptacantha TaxID=393608 RepID=A0A7C9D3A6_OPUST
MSGPDVEAGSWFASSDLSTSLIGPGKHLKGNIASPDLPLLLSLGRDEGKTAGRERRGHGRRETYGGVDKPSDMDMAVSISKKQLSFNLTDAQNVLGSRSIDRERAAGGGRGRRTCVTNRAQKFLFSLLFSFFLFFEPSVK